MAAVAITAIAGYVVARIAIYQQLDRELLQAANQAAAPIVEDYRTMGGLRKDNVRSINVLVSLVRADGSVALSSSGPAGELMISDEDIAIARLQAGSSTRSGFTVTGERQRIAAVPLDGLDGRYALVVGRPLAPYDSILRTLLVVLFVSWLIGISAASIIGNRVARSSLRPLRRLSAAVARVTETDDLRPITVRDQDELGSLTHSFNTMLRTLADSRDRQRQLIADAGHELRTPLTSLRTNIELLVADEKAGMLPEGARGEILKDIAAQLAEFTSLIGDLVLLTREDGMAPEPEPIDLADVVEQALDRVRLRGPGLNFNVSLEPYRLMGEPDSLERAVLNLLDNAVKFSPEGGTICVQLRDGRLCVCDDGPGIPEDDLTKVFDRFFRAETARNTPGTGLGLSIVAQTVARHGGTVRARNRPEGGAEFSMELPHQLEAADDTTLG
ncbi:MAG: HAMP domain-containing histidine kinase [Propionibacterium sp.]|nr:HAMP domain-containing histidine kinase [Propionibacterium sp.]